MLNVGKKVVEEFSTYAKTKFKSIIIKKCMTLNKIKILKFRRT